LRVLLTGANGFIGSQITAELRAAGHDVVAAVRDPAKFQRRFPGSTAFAIDMNSATIESAWAGHLSGIDAVVNCAGTLQSRNGEQAHAIHTASPIALFHAAAARGIRKIIQISAVSIAADTEYAVTKKAADDALMALDVDWVILRPSLVYGRVAYGGTAMLRALAACPLVIPVIGKGDQMVTPIAVEDLARSVRRALDAPGMNRKVLYPCGPETMTLATLMQRYRGWLGLKPAPLLHVPRALVGFAAKLGDALGTSSLTTTALVQLDHGNAADPAVFAAVVGQTPRSVDEVLATAPAGTADLWHARLYLLRPVIQASLVLLWALSGLSGLLAPSATISALFPWLGAAAAPLGYAASLFDLVIAALVLRGRWPKQAFILQLLTVLGYTLIVTLSLPHLWLDLFGPLLKNIPILALIIIQRVLDEER
jgi:uncharacterized protein YbjT (DUF2867 family)